MSTSYDFVSPVTLDFEALAKQGITRDKSRVSGQPHHLCLTDGANYVHFYPCKDLLFADRYGKNDASCILDAIRAMTGVPYLSEHEDGYWDLPWNQSIGNEDNEQGDEQLEPQRQAMLTAIETLGGSAMPISMGDLGSDRQINAENVLFEAVRAYLSQDAFEMLEDWCLKATPTERITEALHVCKDHLTPPPDDYQILGGTGDDTDLSQPGPDMGEIYGPSIKGSLSMVDLSKDNRPRTSPPIEYIVVEVSVEDDGPMQTVWPDRYLYKQDALEDLENTLVDQAVCWSPIYGDEGVTMGWQMDGEQHWWFVHELPTKVFTPVDGYENDSVHGKGRNE